MPRVNSLMCTLAQSRASRPPMQTSPHTALTDDHPMALMQTKLYRPRNRSDLITRTRLLDRLSAGLSGRITLVSAPAGFGKTTLLAEWVQTIDRPTAWLSLDAARQRACASSSARSLPPCKPLFQAHSSRLASLFIASRLPTASSSGEAVH